MTMHKYFILTGKFIYIQWDLSNMIVGDQCGKSLTVEVLIYIVVVVFRIRRNDSTYKNKLHHFLMSVMASSEHHRLMISNYLHMNFQHGEKKLANVSHESHKI